VVSFPYVVWLISHSYEIFLIMHTPRILPTWISRPLQDITEGRINSIVKNTGVTLCNNLKIENKIKNNQSLGIRDLGAFYTQYGYEKTKSSVCSKEERNYE